MAAHPHYGRTDAAAPAILPVRALVSPGYLYAKRVLDVVGASVGLVFLLPLILPAALAIWIESRGPIFYFQERLGENGVPFRMVKLRSMVVDADRARCDLQDQNEASGPVFKIRQDPRMTRVGRLIRKASIDELPQLWHVLTGQMSLVGPRPPIPEEVAHYQPWQRERLAARPGLTCIWQVSGRSDIPFEDWVELDIRYVRTRSFWLDLRLLLLTIPAVLTGRGAY
jgi:lipopolysaccharide/colanic/teichoic acid biosynthesis glycosyltransferase